MLYEPPVSPWVLAVAVFLATYACYMRLTSTPYVPDGLPWIGLPQGLFAKRRAKISGLGTRRQLLLSLYEKYSKKGLSCIYPSFMGQPEVVLPPSQLSWILNQPASVLSVIELHRQALQSDYTMLDSNIVRHPIHERMIVENMIKQVGTFTEPVMDEFSHCFEDYWALRDNDWHDVCLWDSTLKFIARVSHRTFVGLPLCRNADFLSNCVSYAADIPVTAMVLHLFPENVKPLIAWLVTLPNRWHFWRASRYLKPLIEQRLAAMSDDGSTSNNKQQPPNDLVTWLIRASWQEQDPYERTATMLAKRYMVINFASVHTTSLTLTNVIFDIVSAPLESRCMEEIYDEVVRVLGEEEGKWTKAGLTKMVRLDSAIRESMRLHNFVALGVQRRVVADGVQTPDGITLPKGANVSVPAYPMHRNQDVYKDADTFDAFRFSRPRETYAASKSAVMNGDRDKSTRIGETNKDDLTELLRHKNLSAVSTGENFLHFGHGRHACPGRFFAIQEIKLFVAHFLLNYEVKRLPERPPNMWIAETMVPPTSATITIRRKQ